MTTIDDYLMNMKFISDHFFAIGKVIFYSYLILCEIKGFDPRYNTIISFLLMRPGYLSFNKF